MDRNFMFSIITAFYNTELYIEECIDSVINQSVDFEKNIQLILVDDGSTDDSAEIALKYKKLYPENIFILSQENKGPSSARNLGLDYATGKYINFLDSDDKLALNALENVLTFFSTNKNVNIVSIPLILMGSDEEDSLHKKFVKNKIVKVYEEFDYPLLHIPSCFIRRESLNELRFDENLIIGENAVLINKLLIHEGQYALINNTEYYFRKRPNETSISDTIKSHKEYFTPKVNYFYKNLIDYSIEQKGYLPDFIKYVIAYDAHQFFGTKTSTVLKKREYYEFRQVLKDVLSYIDDDIIINHRFIPETVKSMLIYLKNDEFHIEVIHDEVFLKTKDHIISALHENQLLVDVVEIINGTLNFSTYYTSSCDYKYFRMEAIKENSDGSIEIYDGKFFDYPTTNRYPLESIGFCWKFDYCVDFKIPITKYDKSRIYFKLIYDEDGQHAEMHNPIQFQNYDAGLSKVCNYLIKDNQMVIYNKKDESFHLQKYSFAKSAQLEVISLLKMIKDHNYMMFSGIFYHLLYLFLYPFMRNKRIWLFQDRKDIADDNAKYLFQYAVKKDDGIKKYFVISKDCDDFEKMKKVDKNMVARGSLKNKFLYLFAEKMISSHVNHSWLNPFFNPKIPYFNGFLTLEKCFLQHGVIKDDLSSWLRKYFQNLHLFLTSSDYERDSIFAGTYNYDLEVVQVLGLPRHDYLKFGIAKKEILFSPTWRRQFVNRQAFEKSDYYYRLKSFLTNERLLNATKDKGYKIVFKPHYDLEPFLDLFTLPDEIEVNTGDSYQKLFNNSSLLVTDYSSVFFDFAFLKKPIIYYHEGHDYHFDEGYFKYDEMGFGDVIESEEELVDKMIEYMNNSCEMEEKYKRRVDGFFKYTDPNNCKRVYDWLYEN